MMLLIKEKWLPGKPATVDNLATAQVLENTYWKRQEIAVANAIAKVLES